MNLEAIQQLLEKTCGLDAARPLVVGVSGGPDSLALMDVLERLEYTLRVAHFDHSLRSESGQEAQYIQKLAAERRLPVYVERADVAAFARRERLSIEEAARILRYRFLFAVAQQLEAQAVAVGHTADDQVETVLMHFLRGAGLTGLKGMSYLSFLPEWNVSIPLVRPLLSIWRKEILAYCAERHLRPVFDRSNTEVAFLRNRLRQELIPFLEEYNPRIKEAVRRMAQTLGEDHAVLVAFARQAWENVLKQEGPGWVALSLQALQVLPIGLQRRVMRTAIERLRPNLRDIDFQAVERALAFVVAPSRSRQLNLIRGLRLTLEGQQLYLMDSGATVRQESWPQMDVGEEKELTTPGSLVLAEGWVLESEVRSDVANGKLLDEMKDPFQAWLNIESLSLPLQVRTRRPGDRFQPLGMNGHTVKLSDFWINSGLPRQARKCWPLVFSADQLVWVPGYRPAHFARLLPDSHQALHLRLRRRHRPPADEAGT